MRDLVSKEEKQEFIEGYNALVDDFLKLGIGKASYIDKNSNISIEKLFYMQGVLVNKMTSHIKMMISWEAEGESVPLIV